MRNEPGYEFYVIVLNPETRADAQPLPDTGFVIVGRPDDTDYLVGHVCDYGDEADLHIMLCEDCLPNRDVVFLRFPELAGSTVEPSETGSEYQRPRLALHHYDGCKSFEEE